jgi:recombinational DNA repair ATPase RecF
LEGLVVLVGANSSGKTHTLEAVAELITLAGKERRPWGGDGQTEPEGLVSFELDQADVSGHPAAELIGSCSPVPLA